VWRTAWCSMDEVTMWRPLDAYANAAPWSARLSDSVPPDVKTTSLGCAPMAAATLALAASIASCASAPNECSDEGLPYSVRKYGVIASSTLGSTLVVALLSK